ncbi:MAG TPA: response regulator transcription factor [Acidimicrobiales bacterium]|nr:response regulator transcription factor [Acidimicrobiales bacterium]
MPNSPSPSPPREVGILLVEDDPGGAEVVATALRAREYAVTVVTTGADALEAVSRCEPDVVVLDLGLPDIDGIEVCRRLRRWFLNPIVVLSADGAEDRKIAALDEGADDYVTKPFSVPELQARLRVALRHRALAATVVDPRTIRLGDVVVDVGAHQVLVGGAPVPLTRKEFALLALLAANAGKVMTHGALMGHVWGSARRQGTESLRVHVTQLRKKLGAGPGRPRILTEPGVGYRLAVPDGDG